MDGWKGEAILMKYFIFATIPLRAVLAGAILILHALAVAIAGNDVGKPDWIAYWRWVAFAE